MTVIRAVTFDAGATLLHPSPPVEEIYARELARDGAVFTKEQLDAALASTWEDVHSRAKDEPDRYGGVRGEEAFWQAFLNRVRGRLDGGEVTTDAFARLKVHFRSPAAWALYPDVLPALDALEARGVALAIVSNWDSHLPRLLDALDLSARFSAVAVSAIEETGKPGSEIFLRTCARLSLSPPECLHVGDSIREDYEAARTAGLRSLLLDREERHLAVPASDRITSLAEITGRL